MKAITKVTASTTIEMRTACWRVGQLTRWSSETASRKYLARFIMVFYPADFTTSKKLLRDRGDCKELMTRIQAIFFMEIHCQIYTITSITFSLVSRIILARSLISSEVSCADLQKPKIYGLIVARKNSKFATFFVSSPNPRRLGS